MKFARLFFVAVIVSVSLLTISIRLAAQQAKVKHHKYKLVDLGTFGGPQGFISPEGNGGPYINSRGSVVAIAQTSTPLSSNSNLAFCFPGPNVNHGLRWQKDSGKVTDLRALSPARHNCSVAVGIKDTGEMVGLSENGVIDPLIGVKEARAVLWEHGKIVDLGTLGGNASGALSINNDGDVVGFALNAIPDPLSFYGLFFENSSNSTQTRAVRWQKGRMKDLGTLGGPDAFAAFVNQRGQILGFSYTSSLSVDPFVWTKGKMKDMGTLGGTSGLATGMNNNGQAAGFSNLTGDAMMHPFYWNGKKMKDLGTFGGSNGAANTLNDAGEVVGFADLQGDQIHHAFLWKPGAKKKTDLGTLGLSSDAISINSYSQVVGSSRINGTTVHAFLWELGEMVDLNDLVSPKSNVQLQEPNAIADNGEIAVNGLPKGCFNGDVCGHPYVLIPNGNCDDDCEARIAASRNNAVATAHDAATVKHGTDTPANKVNRLSDRLTGRYHIPEQPAVPSD